MALTRIKSSNIADETVVAADIADGSITDAKIQTGVSSSKLTGNLPAISGASLTNLTSANLSGALPAISGANLTGVSTDTSALENNIAILAFKTQSANDLAKFNLVDQVIDEYKDATGVTFSTAGRVGLTATTGYLASVYTSDTDTIPSVVGDWDGSTGSFNTYGAGTISQATSNKAVRSDWTSGTGDFTVKAIHTTSTNVGGGMGVYAVSEDGSFQGSSGSYADTAGMMGMTASYWYHQNGYGNDGGHGRRVYYGGSFDAGSAFTPSVSGDERRIERRSGVLKFYFGTAGSPSLIHTWATSNTTDMRVAISAQGTNFQWTSMVFTAASSAAYATGSFESTDVVPQDATNKDSIGLVVLYKDNGSADCVLNTDIVAQVRANTGQAYDSGSNTLALVGAGTYSDGLKIAIAPAISVTAGQLLSYKISFANQVATTKEARIHGVAMTY